MIPTVTVVVPTFNYGHYLGGALRSILAQTFRDFEVLVVDDGSTDDTAAVAASFLGDARVRYLRQPNQGPAAARNLGIEQARGTLVAFLDADDRWLPTKLAKQVALLVRQPALGLVCCRRQWIDRDSNPLEKEQPPLHRGWVLPELFRTNFVCFSSAVFRRRALLEAGGFDQTVDHSEDYDLLLRITERYPVDYVDEALVLYRTGHSNLSSQSEKRFRAVCAIMTRFLAEGGRAALPASLVRRSWAETYCHWGCACRDASWGRAVGMQLRALAWLPWLGEAWQELASLCVPATARKWLKQLGAQPRTGRVQPDRDRVAELAGTAQHAPVPRP